MKYLKKFNEDNGIKFNPELLSPKTTNIVLKNRCGDILSYLKDDGYSPLFTSNKANGFNIEIYGKENIKMEDDLFEMVSLSNDEITNIEYYINELSNQVSDEYFLYHKYLNRLKNNILSVSFYYLPIEYKLSNNYY